MTAITHERKDRIYGIRQIDDLVLWIAYKDNDRKSLKQAKLLKEELLNKNTGLSSVYDGGANTRRGTIHTTKRRE